VNGDNSSENATYSLTRRLDEVRDRLMEVQGVSGVGIGRSTGKDPSCLVIQVFVAVPARSEEIEGQLRQILGPTPYEIVCISIPDAY